MNPRYVAVVSSSLLVDLSSNQRIIAHELGRDDHYDRRTFCGLRLDGDPTSPAFVYMHRTIAGRFASWCKSCCRAMDAH